MITITTSRAYPWHTNELEEAGERLGVTLDIRKLDRMDKDYDKMAESLEETVFVFKSGLRRVKRVFLYDNLKKQGKRIVNGIFSDAPLMRSQSWQQEYLRQFTDLNLIETHTWYSLKDVVQAVKDGALSFPMLGKPEYGSFGRGVTRFDSMDELNRFEKMKVRDYVFQPFIENDGDYRVFVIRDNVVAIMKRIPKNGMIVNNIKKGAVAHEENDEDVRAQLGEMAVEATRALGLDYAGIDIMFDKNAEKYRIIEVNLSPMWQATQTVAETNIAEELVKFLVKVDQGDLQLRSVS